MDPSSALLELASVSLACRDSETLLKTLAARLGPALGARAVLVWLSANGEKELSCRARWIEPGERIAPVQESISEGLLAELCDTDQTRRLSSGEIDPEQLVHIEESQRGRVKTALYATLHGAEGVAGAVEVLNKRGGEFTSQDAAFLEEANRLAGQALANLKAQEAERESQLGALERLTSLYDLSRVFNSTLELHELLPVIVSKVRDLLGAQACNLWLVDSAAGNLRLARRAGEDPTIEEGARAPLNEGHLGEVVQQGSPQLVEDAASEPSLESRRQAGGDFEIGSVACAPLRKDQEVLGVVELVNKAGGGAFDEDDLFFLASVTEQAAVALHNANLLESERKVHVLDALLKVSQEITSTLDLDHVLTTVVHQAATLVPFDRCVIGFFDRSRFVLGAVSGETAVPKSREMDDLTDILEWSAGQNKPVSADHYEEGWEVTPEEGRAQIVRFLEAHEYNGFFALPLRDEQGTLGTLALLSSDADFLTANHRETLAILANQVTVAIRNAQLYQQMPLAGLLHPFAEKKKRLLAAVPQARRVEYAWRAAAVALLLVVVPWPMRVGTNATLVPAQRRMVSAIVGGIARKVLVREGDKVSAGQLLAQLDDGEDRIKLAQAQTDLALARRELADAEFRRDLADAGQARLHAALYEAQVKLEQERVEQAQLRAPIPGIVVTPKVEEKFGTALKPGEAFCELVEQDRMAAELNVPETDLPLIRPETRVALKLNAFPTATFSGRVERIGARSIAEENQQFFVVRALFQNPGGLAREGMAGRARIRAGGGWFESGWYPVGYVLFRTPVRWAWKKAWSLLP
jgi:RND family efflux transporter MFP subunit